MTTYVSRLETALGLIQRQKYNEAQRVLQVLKEDAATMPQWLTQVDHILIEEDPVAPTRTVEQVRAEVARTMSALARLDGTIQDLNQRQMECQSGYKVGAALVPAFGIGALMLLNTALNARQVGQQLHALRWERQRLLDNLEVLYTELNGLRARLN